MPSLGRQWTPEEHAAAIGATYVEGGGHHNLYLGDFHRTLDVGGMSRISWHGESGQINDVQSKVRGDASRLHATARAIAADNPSIPVPKHSRTLTKQGRAWARKEKRKYRGA